MPDPEAGARLRKLLERQRRDGETWAELAARLKVTRAAVMAWMSGTNEPDAASLRRMADEFGMTRSAILAEMDGER